MSTEVDDPDYAEFRGKCLEMSKAACAADPTLTLVRGHYICPLWGEQPHWWTVRDDGTVYDPTARQFPSKGCGEYVPFDGIAECAECRRKLLETEAIFYGRYPFCSGECIGSFLGVSAAQRQILGCHT